MSDSISNGSITVASSNPREFSKKKRANRSAKLKQGKLDVRREQWLSQVKKNGGCKEELNSGGTESKVPSLHVENNRGKQVENLEIKMRDEVEFYGDGSSMHHYSDFESLSSNSPTSHISSVLSSNDSGVNFTASSRSSSSSDRSSSSSGRSFCSGHICDEDEGGNDDDCLDDWEVMADALEEKDEKQQNCSTKAGYALEENSAGIDNVSSANSESGRKLGPMVSCCAWHPDDAYRPQNLPNLAKQCSFPLNSERQFGQGSIWACFAFFHKRILEEDGRCPGCRKKYECEPVEGEATLDGGCFTFRLARSCIMITRST